MSLRRKSRGRLRTAKVTGGTNTLEADFSKNHREHLATVTTAEARGDKWSAEPGFCPAVDEEQVAQKAPAKAAPTSL